MFCRTVSLMLPEVDQFKRDGFLVIEKLIDAPAVNVLKDRFEPLFAGRFETGVYPDEWYWREGLSLPDVTRHMANAWKSDLTVAALVLSPEIGRLTATLADWPGARLGQDTIWWKPPGAKEIAYHQDSTYVSFLDPPEMMTCWITLDDTSSNAGTIEYARGSHLWPRKEKPGAFHAPVEAYRSEMERAAAALGIRSPEIVKIEVRAGVHPIPYGFSEQPSEWITTLGKLSELDFDTLIPGHGDPQIGKTYVQGLAGMLRSVQTQVKAGIDAGLDLESVRKRVDLSEFEKQFAGDDPIYRYSFREYFATPNVERTFKELKTALPKSLGSILGPSQYHE